MPVVKADLGLCQGYANCIMAAGDYFDLDDDGVHVAVAEEQAGLLRCDRLHYRHAPSFA